MPLKFTKEVSAKLFRYVKAVDIKYNLVDIRARSAHNVYERLQAPRFEKSNPKMKVNLDMHYFPKAPTVTFKLADGSDLHFENSGEYSTDEIFFEVHLKTMAIDLDYELNDKNIDDE